VLHLTHGVVLLVAPQAASADSLGDLRNTTIGVVGGAINQPVVDALKQVYQFDRAEVAFQDIAIVLLSQKVARFEFENQLFEKIQGLAGRC
jgi:hypothetical protein